MFYKEIDFTKFTNSNKILTRELNKKTFAELVEVSSLPAVASAQAGLHKTLECQPHQQSKSNRRQKQSFTG